MKEYSSVHIPEEDLAPARKEPPRLKSAKVAKKYSQASSNVFVRAMLSIAIIVTAWFVAIRQNMPPDPMRSNAPASDFSSGRALEHVRNIAQRPHPTGSSDNARIREYIFAELNALGLDPRVDVGTAVLYDHKPNRSAQAGTVYNVVGRMRGTANTRAVMLAAHYDSVANGIGAADDSTGVATLLETARALKSGPSLDNDVVFLFTDGEELGSLGAREFVRGSLNVSEIGVVFNFEARGSCGPSLLFETSKDNDWLVQQVGASVPYPVASALFDEVYQRLPNDTDLSVFKKAGLPGLNFANVNCSAYYHTSLDDVANLGEATLQHDGSYAIALARQFGRLNLCVTHSGDATFFNVLRTTIHYSKIWNIPVASVAVLLLLGAVYFGIRTSCLTAKGLLLGFLGWGLGAAVSLVAAEGFWRFLFVRYGSIYTFGHLALLFVAIEAAILFLYYLALGRKTSSENLTVGALLWWAILAMYTASYAPGGSYLFSWPLLFSAMGLVWLFFRPESNFRREIVWAIPSIVCILLLGAVLYFLIPVAPDITLLPISVTVALLIGFLLPLFSVISTLKWWLLPGTAALAALGLFLGINAERGHDGAHPDFDSIFYVLNADVGKAVWASTDGAPDSWTSQFLGGTVRSGKLDAFVPIDADVLKNDAPVARLVAPVATVLSSARSGLVDQFQVNVCSRRKARSMWIAVENAKVLEASVNGQTVGENGDGSESASWRLRYTGLHEECVQVDLKLMVGTQATLEIVDVSDGLPQELTVDSRERPAELVPSPWPSFNMSTLVQRSFKIGQIDKTHRLPEFPQANR